MKEVDELNRSLATDKSFCPFTLGVTNSSETKSVIFIDSLEMAAGGRRSEPEGSFEKFQLKNRSQSYAGFRKSAVRGLHKSVLRKQNGTMRRSGAIDYLILTVLQFACNI
jgi:hypothetical protein